MVAVEILCNPIPKRLERSVVQWVTALHVHERSLLYARDLMRGELTKAIHDFYRMNAACNTDLVLDVDFFQHANEPLEEIRGTV